MRQIFGRDMIEWRNFASERMISPAEGAGFLQRQYVSWLFYDAEHSAKREESAHISQMSLAAKNPQRLQERIACRVSVKRARFAPVDRPEPHHPERDPFRGARADSRHLSELRNQIPDCRRIFRSSQSALLGSPRRIRFWQIYSGAIC